MKHLGDITKINGADIEPVWCITGGSPCQDLSVAGKRAGLAGARSGLFMEQVRVVKEMREHDRQIGRTGDMVRPRFLVWENVPGAFSSNFKDGFGDFGAVLEEIVRIAEPTFSLPRLSDKQKWTKAGAIDGDGWSVAWRTHDAQYWGVPQRRRRISVAADFGGQCAGEILFERESVSGDIEPGEQTRKEAAGDFRNGAAVNDRVANSSGSDIAGTLDANYYKGQGEREGVEREYIAELILLESNQNHQAVAYGIDRSAFNQGINAQYKPQFIEELSATIVEKGPGAVCQSVPYTLQIRSGCEGGGKGPLVQVDKSATLSTVQSQTLFHQVYCCGNGQVDQAKLQDNVGALNCMHDQQAVLYSAIFRKTAHPQNAEQAQGWEETEVNDTLNAFDNGEARTPTAVCEQHVYENHSQDARYVPLENVSETVSQKYGTGGNNQPLVAERVIRWIVRRLTPLECERLQGFPDKWTNIGEWTDSKGKKHKDADSPKYKALGNSIAIPFWLWMTCRMAEYLPEGATLGSLFDGIGGFPLCWETVHGKGTARWASEIEEFPIAVTQARFGNG